MAATATEIVPFDGERTPDAVAGLGRSETGSENGARVFASRCRIHLGDTFLKNGA